MERLARYQHYSSYVQKIREKIGLYRGWVEPQDLAAEAYEAYKQDLIIKSNIDHLTLCASGQDWYIEPENKKDAQAAAIVETGLKKIEGFNHARKSLSMSAFEGLTLQKKCWSYGNEEICGIRGKWSIPRSLEEVSSRRLRIERSVGNRDQCYWTIWKSNLDRYVILESQPEAQHSLHDYVWSFWEKEEANPYGEGLAHILFSTAYIKSKILQYRASLAERWGKEPWIKAKLDLSAGILADTVLGPQFQSVSSRATEAMEVFKKMRAGKILVQAGEDDFDLIETGAANDGILDNFLRYLDELLAIGILGATLTTQSGSGHSFAQSQTHQTTIDARAEYLKNRIENDYSKYLITDFVRRNWMHFVRIGLPGKLNFKIRSESQSKIERENKKEYVSLVIDKQIPVEEAELYETIGFGVPKPDSKIFISTIQQQPSVGGLSPQSPPISYPSFQMQESLGGSPAPFLLGNGPEGEILAKLWQT